MHVALLAVGHIIVDHGIDTAEVDASGDSELLIFCSGALRIDAGKTQGELWKGLLRASGRDL